MIPQFPISKKLEIEDFDEIESHTRNYPPYSDFGFVSMWGYDTQSAVELSYLNTNLVVLFTDYITSKKFYSFLGNNHTLSTVSTLLDYSKQYSYFDALKLVPECNITDELLRDKDIEIVEDPDNHDYILSIGDLAPLISAKHYNKKKQLNIFEREYPNIQMKQLDLLSSSVNEDIFDLFEQWRVEKNKTDEDVANEKLAIIRTVSFSERLKTIAVGLYDESKLVGFALADTVKHPYAEFHFIKASTQYRGIYSALHIYLARELEKIGCRDLNIEQDLGIESLRVAKNQWHPSYQLKKYTIARKCK